MAAAEELLTERVRLRRWRPEDEAAMAEINRDPEVTRYINRSVDPDAISGFYRRVTGHWEDHGFGFWALEARGDDFAGDLIGFSGVSHPTFLPELAARPELGWRLARRAWGRGLAGEAASAARDHAFDTLVLGELISIIHPENARSRRLAQRLDMTFAERVHNPVVDLEVEVWRTTAAERGPRDNCVPLQ